MSIIMTGSITVKNGNATLKFEYSSSTEKMNNRAGDAVHELWDRGQGNHGTEEEPIEWDDLSVQDKVDILDEYINTVIKNMAKQYHGSAAAKAGRDVAEAEFDDRY